jgi:hypothetical protein
MHPRTAATLQRLETAPWFCKVGERDTEGSIIVLSSWAEAMKHCQSPDWEALQLEAANCYRERLVERSRDRFALWNIIAKGLKAITIPFVARRLEEVIRKNDLPKAFEDAVQWDILHLCMEAEYADVFPPGFYAAQGYWYTCGHFPCGWQGDFPKGTRIIY